MVCTLPLASSRDNIFGKGIYPQRADGYLGIHFVQPGQQLVYLGVVGNGGADQPDAPPGVQPFPCLLEDFIQGAEAQGGVSGVDQAEAAAPGAAALHLDEIQIAQLGVRRENDRMGGEVIQVFRPLAGYRGRRGFKGDVNAGQLPPAPGAASARAADVFHEHREQSGQNRLGFTDAESSRRKAPAAGVGGNAGPPGDNQGVGLIAVGGKEGNAGGFKDLDDVEVVQLVGNRESQDGEIGQRPSRLDSGGGVFLHGIQEDALADDPQMAVQQAVNGVDAQVGHAQVVGVGIDKGYRQSPPQSLTIAPSSRENRAPGRDPWNRFSCLYTASVLFIGR